jgi:protein-S-isoprenylcysteine O-methyltransferase Ste14
MSAQMIGQTTLGIIILCLLAMLVAVKRIATGTILGDKAQGGFLIHAVNVFNLFFLLVANPLAGILLVTGRLDDLDRSRVAVNIPVLLTVLEIGGLLLYVAGFALMAWALLTLGCNYQLGGCKPLESNVLIIRGPYRLVRHPMYLAAILIAFGLACLVQSIAYAGVFIVYLALMIYLLPYEEKGLIRAYGEQYIEYRRSVGGLLPTKKVPGTIS